jgi:hypothetical protein
MLRKSPTRAEAFLAANRHNALKSTGPRTVGITADCCFEFSTGGAGSKSSTGCSAKATGAWHG